MVIIKKDRKLLMVKDISWLNLNKLDDFVEEVKDILIINKLLSRERIEKTSDKIKSRLEFIKQLKATRDND